MSRYPGDPAARDRFVLDQRSPRPPLDPWRTQGQFLEQEPTAEGALARVATILLTGRECPWRCAMCDLWKHTTQTDTPAGAIAAQIASARAALGADAANDGVERRSGPWAADIAKLYNAGSFFDPRAVPDDDYDAIAAELTGLTRVIVECHPKLVGPRTARFSEGLERRRTVGHASPALEVAMGLETAHPDALERLNKRMTLDDFTRASDWLREAGIPLRVFLLVSPPFVPLREHDLWLARSLDVAVACGASAVSLIPTRDGNGTVEALAAEGLFRQPRLQDLERSLELALAHVGGAGVRVFADIWDVGRFADCPQCLDARRTRLVTINLTQRTTPHIRCRSCGVGHSS